MNLIEDQANFILDLLRDNGDSEYGNEAVTQFEHALQTATLARLNGGDSALVVAALLHDVGHLLHDLPDDAPDQGVDDRHEVTGGNWLKRRFGDAVVEPVRLHVPAKRYLCAVDPAYMKSLSAPSIQSLELQGGPMTPDEVANFEKHPFYEQAVRLRRWDDEAKDPDAKTLPLESFYQDLIAALQCQI